MKLMGRQSFAAACENNNGMATHATICD